MKKAMQQSLVVLIALWAGLASAQQQPVVTDADLARARSDIKEQMQKLNQENIEAARRKHIVPQQNGSRDEAINATRPQMPRFDALAKPATLPNVDIGALAKKLSEGKSIAGMPAGFAIDVAPKLKVFITMAMPAESIKSLMAQAEAVGARVVLRGMVNDSLKETAAVVRKLRGKNNRVGVSIDPEAFDRYGVTQAPAFVLVKASNTTGPQACSGKTCAPTDTFALVSGDVSIEYALEKLEQRAPRFKTEARVFLKKIRG